MFFMVFLKYEETQRGCLSEVRPPIRNPLRQLSLWVLHGFARLEAISRVVAVTTRDGMKWSFLACSNLEELLVFRFLENTSMGWS